MDWIKRIIQTFFYVITGCIFSTAVFITIFFPNTYFSVEIIWQVIILSLVTSLGPLFYRSKKEISKKQMRLRNIIHYVYINLAVFGCAITWEWINIHRLSQLITLFLLNTCVYTGASLAMFNNEKRVAEQINERLRLRYQEEERKEEE